MMHSKRLREKVKQDYDSIAAEFSDSRRSDWKEFEVFRAYLKPRLRVLDLGCGNGRLVDFLKEWKVDYRGIDQSAELVACARKAHSGVHFEVADMAELPALEQRFDRVFMIASFHHLPRKDQESVLRWIAAHLAPGGMLLMTNWNLFQWRFWKAWLKALLWPRWGFKGLEIPWNHGVKRYYYAFSEGELRRLLKRTGFRVIEEHKGRNFVTLAAL